jgi:hypothetical protein
MTLPLIGGMPNVDCLQLAVAALPGYRQAVDTASACDQWLSTPPELPTVDPELAEHITEEWLTAERARENALTDYEARRRIVQSRRELAANQAQSIFNTGADLILGVLQDELTKLLNRAAGVLPELGGATTPAEAIATDAGAAWKQFGALSDEYSELRSAQTFVMLRASVGLWRSCTPSLPSEDHCNLAFIRNIDELWPNWRQYGLDRRRVDLSDNATPARDQPWPADSGPELLVWLLTSDAEAWIPTTKQLRELFNERNAAPEDVPEQQSDDDSSVFDSLLIGPLEVERKRQAQAAQSARQRKPDYNRIATPIRTSSKPQPAELGGTTQ